ncbi:uncharacterized protein LACBIDRAFT_329283 [Laccaria bicolor S238N-H82]|uniref:Predicted protein n=1 Tax=Laccaria bicolor (strain S238N-H82 / ATCC MYA-4686) TaxID=486041 RepID=B0DH29_LACBS|nr:uncharacterized protein LACBIDRAFT_329283 [Laccaria bicolor S238N-H82]EDR06040.1 predicted protein [Laccaria bicolor S238N-H82]|eukprot:XP_001883328.1 predicted protein [Laccaria bicolor S238N-H82]
MESSQLAQAGQPLTHQESRDNVYGAALGGGDNPWAPFNSKKDWEIARWAKLRGAGSTAFSELLATDGVHDALNLSYKNSEELNRIINTKLPGRPQFTCREVVQSGEVVEFYMRDIIECLRALWGDPDFDGDLILEPERLYADEDMTIRIYHEMNTRKWWWETQNITIVPIIISSDKTQLTQFRGKQAYPIYLTISNIPKHICRKPSRQGQVLLAYLPTSKLGHITNKSSHHRCISNLFHHCMQTIVKPLERAGHDGIILISGDGAARRCFPILAAYVGDYPEQVLVSLVKTGTCPICPAPRDEIGDWDSILEPRDAQNVIEALNAIDKGATEFMKACADAGIKPVQCVFWKNLPYIDISSLSRLTSCSNCIKGCSNISSGGFGLFLLALVADVRLPDGHSNVRLVRTVRAVLNFIYLARYPIHTSKTLAQMNDALHTFHVNCDILVSLGIRTHFNIPKLHNASHYYELIQLYGTADNFNTEFTERLHIDLAKDVQQMAKHPTHQGVPIDVICTKYGATQFIPALSCFVAQYQHPEYLKAQVEAASTSIHIPFSKISVFHHLKFISYDVYSLNPLDKIVVDSIHTDPVHFDKYRNVVPGRFDTAVVRVKDSDGGASLNLEGSKFQVIQGFALGGSGRAPYNVFDNDPDDQDPTKPWLAEFCK